MSSSGRTTILSGRIRRAGRLSAGSLERHRERRRSPWEAATTKAEPAQWAPAGEVSLASEGQRTGPRLRQDASGRAFSFDGKGYFDAGDAAAFDIDDRFTLSAWVYSDSAPDGSILTRMQDTPRGRGYGVLLNKGKVHVHLTSNYDDDAIRIETEETLSPNAGITSL